MSLSSGLSPTVSFELNSIAASSSRCLWTWLPGPGVWEFSRSASPDEEAAPVELGACQMHSGGAAYTRASYTHTTHAIYAIRACCYIFYMGSTCIYKGASTHM